MFGPPATTAAATPAAAPAAAAVTGTHAGSVSDDPFAAFESVPGAAPAVVASPSKEGSPRFEDDFGKDHKHDKDAENLVGLLVGAGR
jgi:hypothetical protein